MLHILKIDKNCTWMDLYDVNMETLTQEKITGNTTKQEIIIPDFDQYHIVFES